MTDSIKVDGGIYRITSTLTIYDVRALEEKFLALGISEGLSLDLSSVGEVDGAGIQWLLAVKARVEKTGSHLNILALTDELSEQLDKAGLSSLCAGNGEF